MATSLRNRASDVRVLTRRVGSGDADAFERLYRAWYARVVRMARAAGGRDEAFCLDIAHDVFVRVATKLPVLDDEAALGAWLSRATLRAVLDALRAERRRRAREGAATGPGSPDGGAGIDEVAWLRSQMELLPTGDFELAMIRLAQQRTLRETGVATGTSGDAAHGRVRRLVERLREAAGRILP